MGNQSSSANDGQGHVRSGNPFRKTGKKRFYDSWTGLDWTGLDWTGLTDCRTTQFFRCVSMLRYGRPELCYAFRLLLFLSSIYVNITFAFTSLPHLLYYIILHSCVHSFTHYCFHHSNPQGNLVLPARSWIDAANPQVSTKAAPGTPKQSDA
jgi:hypothetical protein